MTELDEYPLAPGLLREWTPRAPELTAASGEVRDEAPPTYNQEWHFRGIASLQGRGIRTPAWLGVGFEIAGELDQEAFRAALRAWVDRHETLRSTLRGTGPDMQRFTAPAGRVGIEDTKVGELLPEDDITGTVQQRLDAATDGTRWPNFTVQTLERAEGTTVLVAYDHSNVDGYSVLATAHELHVLYADCLRGRAPRVPSAGSYVAFSRAERDAARDVDRDHPAVGEWDAFIDECGGNLPGFPLELGVGDGELLPHTGARRHLLDEVEAEEFERFCRHHRGSALAGVLAASAVVARELRGDDVYRVVSPFHTRASPEWSASMGWYVGAGPVRIDLSAARRLSEVLAPAQSSARQAMRVAKVPFAKVVDVLGLDLQRHSPDVFSFVSYLDMREIPGARDWADWNARTLVRMSYGDKANLWVNRTHGGLGITARYPDTPAAQHSITRYFDGVAAVLRDVVTSGDHALR
ncbi:acyltransferase papA2 [Saccharopolyspora sp. HNM0983]|uniref:Acyltransferase papA2 n=1 Tax=Saccharopolyspora montiporae TaxID=2781240 RepID=A0A929B9W5_9PSEU|nr:condensation domain-containing protein [Saccharopolyspora sp. HNM0983]MBE9375974.1 acyltransferase papA2 [Saccharopolyspora sp. HNM0983]